MSEIANIMRNRRCSYSEAKRIVESESWKDRQRRVALACFRIVQGKGDAGSEFEFNCRNVTEQAGWMRLAARIIAEGAELRLEAI